MTTKEKIKKAAEASLFEPVDTLHKNLMSAGFAEEDIAIIRTENGDTNTLCEKNGKRYFIDIVVKEKA